MQPLQAWQGHRPGPRADGDWYESPSSQLWAHQGHPWTVTGTTGQRPWAGMGGATPGYQGHREPGARPLLEPLLASLQLAAEAFKAQRDGGVKPVVPGKSKVRGRSVWPVTGLLPPGVPASRAELSELPNLCPVPRLPGPVLRLVCR